MLLREMVSELGADVIGEFLWNKYHRWPAYSKFFDNLGPLPHHIHQRDEHAALTGQAGKPEMYFFPAQVNNYRGERAETYFGLNPGTTKEELKQSLMNFTKGDNKILELSRAYKQEVDTGYDVPAGVLHAPGTLCTYEPQFASDVFAMYQSVLWGDHCTPEELLWKDTPQDKLGDFDYLGRRGRLGKERRSRIPQAPLHGPEACPSDGGNAEGRLYRGVDLLQVQARLR